MMITIGSLSILEGAGKYRWLVEFRKLASQKTTVQGGNFHLKVGGGPKAGAMLVTLYWGLQ